MSQPILTKDPSERAIKRRCLAIDTSGPFSSVALQSDNDGQIYQLIGTAGNSHNEELAVLVEDVIEAAGISAASISHLIVGSGPGSFTGLRIGFSFMKGLAYALRVPLRAASSLEAMAYQFAGEFAGREVIFVSVADARSVGFFVGIYLLKANGEMTTLRSPVIIGKMDLAGVVDEYRARCNISEEQVLIISQADTVLVGVDFAMRSATSPATGMLKMFFQEKDRRPIEIGSGVTWQELALIQPEYIRAVAAKKISER